MLALDLSLSSTGWARFHKGKLIASGSIKPCESLSNFRKLHNIFDLISGLIKEDGDIVVVEDTYSGPNKKTYKELSRLAGTAIYLSIKYTNKDPVFYEASKARKLVGINTKVTKFDSQIWIIEQFFSEINIKPYMKLADEVRKDYVSRKITKSQYDYQLDEKLSKLVERETGISNDQTDSVIVGLAHLEATKK